MSEDKESFIKNILTQVYRAEQVDLLNLAIINLLDMVKDGEIDLLLEQSKKSIKQKALFIQKIVDAIESKELRTALQSVLTTAVKASMDGEQLDFFREKNLGELLRKLLQEAENIAVVRLTLAIDFKEKDLREMISILEEKMERKVVLDITVDSHLIGGAILQVGNYLSDYSLKARLEQFRSHWHQAVVER